MPIQTKQDLLNHLSRGRLRREITSRRERGDSYQEIARYLTNTYDVMVSVEGVRLWYLEYRRDDDTAA